jgi:PleD family two-component response regulator
MKQRDWPVTASLGAVTCRQARDLDAILREADEVLYGVKRAGRNAANVKAFDPQLA